MKTIVAALLLFVTVGPALAEEPRLPTEKSEEAAARARAKRHNAMAKKLFSLGLFQEAAEEYQKAYQAKAAPAFLFNLAQCYKRLPGKPAAEKAIFYFRGFLNNVPDTPMRDDIEKEIASLERKLAERPKAAAPFYKRWWFWTAVGLAAVGATVGTVIALQPDDMQPVKGTGGDWTLP